MNIDDKLFLEKLVSVVPSSRQMKWQQMEYYNFVHFGMSTMLNKQWGTGKTSLKRFNPPPIDTDEWARILKESGSKGAILTVKHHDGFCLYPSKYTDYTIQNTPYKNGEGDLVKEFSDSLRKYGLKFGVYLSPWDRHEKTYGTPQYNDFYCNQLTELLTGYGEVFTVWMDGACGEKKNGKKQIYDFPRYFETVRKLQPDCVLSICGSDVRWIGNEGGECRSAEWSVVPAKYCTYESVNAISQASEDFKFINKPMEAAIKDLGSREAMAKEEDFVWYPAEMDVSITTNGFFYHRGAEKRHLSSAERLLELYLNSVGHNATFLLNIPPDKKGIIKPEFIKVLNEFSAMRNALFENPVSIADVRVSNDGLVTEIRFVKKERLKTVVLKEDITKSQRVERYALYAQNGEKKTLIRKGETIGYKEIVTVLNTVCDGILLVVEKSRLAPHLLPIEIYSEV